MSSSTSPPPPGGPKKPKDGAAGLTHPRRNAWVARKVWDSAKARSVATGGDFTDDVRWLITAYGDGVFGIAPQKPGKDPSRAPHAVYPTVQGWERATERARAEHGASASHMVETILERFAAGEVVVRRSVEVVEVRAGAGGRRGPGPASAQGAQGAERA